MRKYLIFTLLGIIISSFYMVNEVNANSEFIVYNTEGSYNLGCELDKTCFEPYFVKIDLGDTVTWINNDDAIHVVISGNVNDGSDGFFGSGSLKTNEVFSFTFDKEGNYEYFCTIHPWMNGFVVVGNVDFEESERNFKFETNPTVLDSGFKIQEFAIGLDSPINMEFLGDDLLVLEKNSGIVRHIKDNKLLDSPVLDVEVSNYGELGLLGITSVEDEVYLFFTEAFHDGGKTLENRIYKYTWNGNELVQPILLKRVPQFEKIYVGGELVSGLDGTVYAVTGDNYKKGLLQNHLKDESYRHYSSMVSPDEKDHLTISDSLSYTLSCVKVSFYHYTTNPFGWQSEQPDLSNNPLELNLFNILANLDACARQFYYDNFSDGHWKDTSSIIQIEPKGAYAAIGIRNSFGLAIDPKTGYLWDTENGPDVYDEINLVETKFNSGWAKIQGPSNGKSLPQLPNYEEYEYSEPEFSWELPVGVTAIEFPNSKNFKKYENFVFVADVNNGYIYKFKLDDTRTKFVFESPQLQDNVLNIYKNSPDYLQYVEDATFVSDTGCIVSSFPCSTLEPMDEILFAKNFGVITDMKFGPDGALYVISLMEGKIYRIAN